MDSKLILPHVELKKRKEIPQNFIEMKTHEDKYMLN